MQFSIFYLSLLSRKSLGRCPVSRPGDAFGAVGLMESFSCVLSNMRESGGVRLFLFIARKIVG